MFQEIQLTDEQLNQLNEISRFLAVRDIPFLSKEALFDKYHLEAADLLVLLGSSLVYPLKLAAKAIQEGLVKKLMLVGGIGHSTHYLYENIRKHSEYDSIPTTGRAEADIYKDILTQIYKVKEEDILIENQSTNCGSNAKNAFELFSESKLDARSFIIMQDPTMQLRTYASFLHEWPAADNLFINFSPYIPYLSVIDGKTLITGINEEAWPINRLISLLMGEIPRLQDNETGYGPKGKNYIVHIEIPTHLINSYENLHLSLQDFLITRS